jgi:hypothetical protein
MPPPTTMTAPTLSLFVGNVTRFIDSPCAHTFYEINGIQTVFETPESPGANLNSKLQIQNPRQILISISNDQNEFV